MSDTEKLLAEIEAALHANGCDCDCGCDSDGHDSSCVLCWPCRCDQLVKIVRDLQNDIEQEYTLKQAARLEAATLQKQLDRQQDGIDYTKGKLIGLAERYQAELEELRDENYGDLLEQMDEAWGPGFNNVRGEEVRAFLDSRRTHKPTRSLRKQLEEMRAELAARDAQIQRLIQGEAIESDYMSSMDDKLLAALNENAEMRGDLVELLEKLYVPMSGDGYRELVQEAAKLRAKYLEVKS